MLWRLGTMLKRFFEAKRFIFHIPKPIQVPRLTYFVYFCISCMYTHHVCMLCVYSMHLFYACPLSMYSMHVFYTGHFVDPQGPFGRMFRKLRIQGRMQIFEKMSQKALNRVLWLECSGGGLAPLESSGILEKCLICVELWPFYCRKRILVPMSYISCLDTRER